jgi:quinol monooxygenase YgiN
MPSSEPLTIIAMTTAMPGRESALRDAQAALVTETLREPGCLRYELHQSLDDGRILIFIETWASEEHWKAHMEGAAIETFRASGATDMIDDFSLYRMKAVAGAN